MNRHHAATLVLAGLLVVSAGCVTSSNWSPDTQPRGSADTQPLGPLDTDIQFLNATADVGVAYQTDGGGAGNGDDGVYVADVNNDGWQDFLAIGGDRPVLYENTGGEFERSAALPRLNESYKAALFFDYDDDGWQDLLLLRPHGTPVLMQNEDGQFERTDGGLGNLTYPMGATVADYDGDDDADLYIYQSGDWADGKPDGYFSLHGHVPDDNGNRNVLYENVGGKFQRVENAGFNGTRWSLAASFVDLNDDDRPDLHVANDYNNDTVYLNRGDGTFDRRLLPAATARNGMSSEIGDFDGDGTPDVFTTNIELPIREQMSSERRERLDFALTFVIKSARTEGNTLMLNTGNGTLRDAAPEFDVRVGGWGWASAHTDLDNDGDGDLLHATQHIARIDPEDPHYTYPMVWERTGENFTNLDATARGLNETDGRGLATLDYDRDGDRDVIVAPYHGSVRVYENTGATGNSLQYRVAEPSGGTEYGATVTVSVGTFDATVQQTVRSDFLSQESRVNHVGLGTADRATIDVTWPDGTQRTFDGVDANQQVRITKAGVESVREFDTSG